MTRLLFIFMIAHLTLFAQNPYWFEVDAAAVPVTGIRRSTPDQSRVFFLDWDLFQLTMDEASGVAEFPVRFPDPSGQLIEFLATESPLMEAELADKYPGIRSFSGRALTEPGIIIRFDMSPKGVSAMWRGPQGIVYVDPFQAHDKEHVTVYSRRDITQQSAFQCHFMGEPLQQTSTAGTSGDELFSFRIAIAATGEYTQFHDAMGPSDPITDTLAEINTALNRVNLIYESELAIRLILVADNDQIIYTDPLSDPYTNNDGVEMLSENQSNLDTVIGTLNYDVGHVFSTGGEGVALPGVVCWSAFKAYGVTGIAMPIGDPFYVDYVAHELGHQFGAGHSFNGTTGNCGGMNRHALTAFEPGSGSTIMGYAGICGAENLQANSDAAFHAASYDEIISFSRALACGTVTLTANQAPTSVFAGDDTIIPGNTAFILQGEAEDLDGDTLVYAWEQMDLGDASPPLSDNGNRPLFRSFLPTTDPSRIFPQISDVLTQTSTIGESMATTDRVMNFRLTVRDQAANGGGVNSDEVAVEVDGDAGPFVVTSQTVAATLDGASVVTITWDVASTDLAPVLCSQVDLALSLDGGLTFNTPLAVMVENDGIEVVELPNIDANPVRIRVLCAERNFFAINEADLELVQVVACSTNFARWGTDLVEGFLDPFENGRFDVVDLQICLFP